MSHSSRSSGWATRRKSFRAMYTTRIGREVYVLHVFQKKSTKGKATPKPDLDLIARRLKGAKLLHAENIKKGRRS